MEDITGWNGYCFESRDIIFGCNFKKDIKYIWYIFPEIIYACGHFH